MAVMALGAPSLLRKRRYCAPRYVRLRSKVEAPTRCCGRAVDYMASPSSKQLQAVLLGELRRVVAPGVIRWSDTR